MRKCETEMASACTQAFTSGHEVARICSFLPFLTHTHTLVRAYTTHLAFSMPIFLCSHSHSLLTICVNPFNLTNEVQLIPVHSVREDRWIRPLNEIHSTDYINPLKFFFWFSLSLSFSLNSLLFITMASAIIYLPLSVLFF